MGPRVREDDDALSTRRRLLNPRTLTPSSSRTRGPLLSLRREQNCGARWVHPPSSRGQAVREDDDARSTRRRVKSADLDSVALANAGAHAFAAPRGKTAEPHGPTPNRVEGRQFARTTTLVQRVVACYLPAFWSESEVSRQIAPPGICGDDQLDCSLASGVFSAFACGVQYPGLAYPHRRGCRSGLKISGAPMASAWERAVLRV